MAAKPITVLGSAPVGSVVRLRAPMVLGGTLILSALADRRGVVADGQPVQDPADARGGR